MQVVVLDTHPVHDGRIERHIKLAIKNCSVIRLNLTLNPEFHLKKFSECGETGISYYLNCLNRNVGGLILSKMQRLLSYSQRLRDLITLLEDAGLRTDEDCIIHVHDHTFLPYAHSLKKLFIPRSKIVYDRHEVWEKWSGPEGLTVRVTETLCSFMIDGVVTVLDSYADYCKNIFHTNNVISVPNYPLILDYNVHRIQSKIDSFTDESPMILSYVGSLDYNFDRDIKLLLELCEAALNTDPLVTVKIGGHTKDEFLLNEFNRLSNRYDGRFQYLGRISRKEVVEICEASHIGFLLLLLGKYRVKTSPNKLYEYLTTATIPVLRADLENSEDFANRSLLFDRLDTKDHILSNFLNLLTDRKRVKELMLQGMHNRHQFSFDKVGVRYFTLYDALLNQ